MCTPKPSNTPSTLATSPTPPNSSAYDQAIARCGAPSTRSTAQSSSRRCAKSRAAIATATAASKAASSATRLRNFSARSSVWRISGRPEENDSTRRPRTLSDFCRSSAQRTNSATWASPRALSSPATARR